MMLNALMIATTMVAAVAMALSLAHALELAGKMRLGRDAYYATQRIYSPGFTFGGIAEPVGGALTLVALLLSTPRGRSCTVRRSTRARRVDDRPTCCSSVAGRARRP